MAIRIDKKALTFLYRFFVKGRTDARQIPYVPAKTRVMSKERRQTVLQRATPESRGVSSKSLVKMLKALEADRTTNVHCIGVWADGAVICEAQAPGYDFSMWSLTHSMCKTVTGIAIGMLVDEKKLSLDTPVYTILNDNLPTLLGLKARQITVRHLLNMSSGSTFNEVGAISSEDWVRSFFEAPVDFEPGTRFAYNSMNSYMLSAIVKRVSGEGLLDYLRPRLFDVIGVPDIMWECCPKGIEKGGWGLYISPETMLKLGTVFVNRGSYNGKQIVSEAWIEQMSSRQIKVSEDAGAFDYGYHMWVCRNGECCLFNGMFGQNILIYPKKKIVVALTATNDEMFQNGRMLGIIMETFSGDDFVTRKRLAIRPRELKRAEKSFFRNCSWIRRVHIRGLVGALHSLHRLVCKNAMPHQFRDICGKSYYLDKNNLSFMPTFLSLIQNNLGEGISEIRFEMEKKSLFVNIREGSESFRMRIGFDEPLENKVKVRGEEYLISVWAQFADNENGQELLKLEFLFPEVPAHRRMKLSFYEDTLCIHMKELPSKDIIGNYVATLKAVAPKSAILVNLLKPQLEKEYIMYKIRDALEPKLFAKLQKPTRVEQPEADDLFEAEFLKIEQETEK